MNVPLNFLDGDTVQNSHPLHFIFKLTKNTPQLLNSQLDLAVGKANTHQTYLR